MCRVIEFQNSLNAVAELEGRRGGGGGRFPLPSGIQPPAHPEGPPFELF